MLGYVRRRPVGYAEANPTYKCNLLFISHHN